jgi:hypothetical protein
LLTLGRVKQHWHGFCLELDGDSLRRVEDGELLLELRRSEIARLVETEGLGIAIQTGGGSPGIFVPAELSGYVELRDKLAAWMPVEHSADRRRHASLLLNLALVFYPAALLIRSRSLAGALTLLFAAVVFAGCRGRKRVGIVLVVLLAGLLAKLVLMRG